MKTCLGLALLVISICNADSVLCQEQAEPIIPLTGKENPFAKYDATKIYLDGAARSHRTTSIIQDSTGFLWLGSRDGLWRFDGSRLKHFRYIQGESNSLSMDEINCLLLVPRNRILIGTNGGGLNSYQIETDSFRHYSMDTTEGNAIQGGKIMDLMYDGNLVWIYSSGHFLHALQMNDGKIVRFRIPHIPEGNEEDLGRIVQDRTRGHLIWLYNKYGVWSFDKSSYQFQHYPFTSDLRKLYFEDLIFFTSMLMDSSGKLWLGGALAGLICFDTHKGTWKIFPFVTLVDFEKIDNKIYSMNWWDENTLLIFDRALRVSLFDIDSGVWQLFGGTGERQRNNLFGGGVVNSLFTSDGTLWLGVGGNYIGRLSPKQSAFQFFSFRAIADLTYKRYMQHFYYDDTVHHKILTGGRLGDGLIVIDFDRNDFEVIRSGVIRDPHEYDITINSITRLSQDTFLLTTAAGLFIYRYGMEGFLPFKLKYEEDNLFQQPFVSSTIDARGQIWAATASDDLLMIDKAGNVQKNLGYSQDSRSMLRNSGINKIFADQQNRIWVLCQSGISIWLPESGNFINLTHEFFGIPYEIAFIDISTIDSKRFWTTTYGGGLLRFDFDTDNTFTWQNINTANGLATNYLSHIEIDKTGILWVSSQAGITRYDLENNTILNLDERDGMRFVGNRVMGQGDGRIFLSEHRGFEWFYPENLQPTSFRETGYLLSCRVNGREFRAEKDINYIEKITLPTRDNNLAFELGTLNLSPPRKQLYFYQLTRIDEDWVQVGEHNSINYSKLAPGEYEFRYKISDSHGYPSEEYRALVIEILKPFYSTVWFYLLCITAIMGSLYLIYRFRIEQLKKLIRVRGKISADLHDDIGSALTSIRVYSEMARKQEDRQRLSGVLDKIEETAGDMIQSMSDIVWMINPKYDDFTFVIQRMENFAAAFLSLHEIQYQITKENGVESVRLPMDRKKNLFLVFKEALNNAVKHAGCKKIEIRFSHIGHQLLMTMTDDGAGFDVRKLSNGNGLNSMTQRAAEMEGEIEITSMQGKGTTISLRIPV